MPQVEMTTYFSVDVETTGPIPGRFDLLTIGCVTVTEDLHIKRAFHMGIKPTGHWDLGTLNWWRAQDQITFDIATAGTDSPHHVAHTFEDFILDAEPEVSERCFVAHPVSFDWPFINYLFVTELQRNPFGHRALCLRSMQFGLDGKKWGLERGQHGDPYFVESQHKHHAFYDAEAQAHTLIRLLEERKALDEGRKQDFGLAEHGKTES